MCCIWETKGENLCARERIVSTLCFFQLWEGRQPLTVATVAIPPAQPWQQTSSSPPVSYLSLYPKFPAGCQAWGFPFTAGGIDMLENRWKRELLEDEHGGCRGKRDSYRVWERLGCRIWVEDGERNRTWSQGYRSWQLCPQIPPSRWLHYTSSLLLIASSTIPRPSPASCSSTELPEAQLPSPSHPSFHLWFRLPAPLPCLWWAPASSILLHPFGRCLTLLWLKMCVFISSLNLSSFIFISFYYPALICYRALQYWKAADSQNPHKSWVLAPGTAAYAPCGKTIFPVFLLYKHPSASLYLRFFFFFCERQLCCWNLGISLELSPGAGILAEVSKLLKLGKQGLELKLQIWRRDLGVQAGSKNIILWVRSSDNTAECVGSGVWHVPMLCLPTGPWQVRRTLRKGMPWRWCSSESSWGASSCNSSFTSYYASLVHDQTCCETPYENAIK